MNKGSRLMSTSEYSECSNIVGWAYGVFLGGPIRYKDGRFEFWWDENFCNGWNPFYGDALDFLQRYYIGPR